MFYHYHIATLYCKNKYSQNVSLIWVTNIFMHGFCQGTDKRLYSLCTHERFRGPGLLHFTQTDLICVTNWNKSLN